MVLKPQTANTEESKEIGEDSDQSSKKKKKRKDKRVEKEYSDWVEVKDPVTGKIIRQKVKITRFKAKGEISREHSVIKEEELGYNLIDESED